MSPEEIRQRMDRAEKVNLLLAREMDALKARVEQLEAKGGADADPPR